MGGVVRDISPPPCDRCERQRYSINAKVTNILHCYTRPVILIIHTALNIHTDIMVLNIHKGNTHTTIYILIVIVTIASV